MGYKEKKNKSKFLLISSVVLAMGLGLSTAAMSINNEIFNLKLEHKGEENQY